jgi:flavodoxin
MKKILTILAFLCISLVACGDKDDDTKPTENQEENQKDNPQNNDNPQNAENPENQNTEPNAANGKTLLVYYSYTGNVKSIANEFLKTVDADVLEVLPAQEGLKYEADNYAIGSALIKAIRDNPDKAESYPEIKSYKIDLEQYSNIVIATPLWWSNMAAPMQTFLFQEGNKLTNKNIMLIVSSASSGISSVIDDAKRLVNKKNLTGEALWINNSNRSEMSTLLTQWIENQKFASKMTQKLIITVSGKSLEADFADNSSAKALAEALKQSPITYKADDYGGFEKVGDLGQSFPQNNEQISTSAGDIILYQGHNLCIYYGENSWNFTRIAKIPNISKEELIKFLGEGEITVTLSVK